MKAFASFALIGLSSAGFLSDVKKVGGFLVDHENTIEKVVNTTIEVAGVLSNNQLFEIIEITEEVFSSDDEFCYVPPSDDSDDDTDTGVGADTDYSDDNNPIYFFKVGDLIKDAKDVAKVVNDVAQKKSASQIIEDGLKVIGDLNSNNENTEELFSFSDALHDAGDVAGIVSAGVEVAGLFAWEPAVKALVCHLISAIIYYIYSY